MKGSTLFAFATLLAAIPFSSSGTELAVSTSAGPGEGRAVDTPRSNPCPPSVLFGNHDGSTENAFTWQGVGVQPPDYGAFAEGYPDLTEGIVCGGAILLTRWGTMTGAGEVDLFVWEYDSESDNPGNVLSVTSSVSIAGVARWPSISTFDLDINDAPAGPNGVFFGYWPRSFVGAPPQFGCAMDQDGMGGVPRTNVAPGIGYPTGWNNPSVAGYGLQAFGLSAWCSGVVPGACCFEDGHCITTAEVSCTTGDWREEVPCDPNPCPQPPPTGACCRPNGTCTITTEAECSDLWLGPDTVCYPNPCPQPPTGACCYPDGQCFVRTEPECPTGDWREGVPCTPNPCPPPPPEGACCYPGGFCAYSTESDCPTGDWREGVACDPNPCPTSGGYINEGGVLVVHDTGLAYTTDSSSYPSDPPLSCDEIDNAAPVGVPTVWKVYAAFPDQNFPRLKALTFGETFDPGAVFVLGAGLPSELDFEIPQNGWPDTPGGGVGISFHQTLTARISEIYWFGGYGYQGGVWSTAPHPVQPTEFADDYTPPHVVPIDGLGSIGFGVAGETPCGSQLPSGACCFASGICMMLPSPNCVALDGVFVDGSCTPNPCPQPPEGACCAPDGSCEVLTQFACQTGDWRESEPCDPNPCPPPPPVGACCHANGSCTLTSELDCGDLWLGPGTSCSPNPCPQPPMGACCYPNGQCIVQAEVDCPTGDWREGVSCTPNPCPMPPPSGACCYGTSCVMASEGGCLGLWLGDGTDCNPNPCCRGSVTPPAGTRDPGAATAAGSHPGIPSPSTRDNPCSPAILHMHHDGTTENAFTWQEQGVIPPDFGALAEGFLGYVGEICGAELLLTRWSGMSGAGTIDLYIWDYDQACDIPGNVLSVMTAVQISGVAAWPGVSAFDIPTGDVGTGGWGFFVGYWPRSFEGLEAQFGCALDENGPGGFPCTNIAPGVGYPTGWHHMSEAGQATQALGLGAWLYDWSVPVEKTTWGRIKALYH